MRFSPVKSLLNLILPVVAKDLCLAVDAGVEYGDRDAGAIESAVQAEQALLSTNLLRAGCGGDVTRSCAPVRRVKHK